ncbi:putative retinoblastoma-binding protein 5 isoform X3 [Apostichopus japonicus]|uniref:Putative retinoblastoma-binding protein 5 isoform X3 n=1 Tax=Stichopus japonicus TaxID=307972 RepID=A0A2G8LH67_STIJA|nr:putative retinoblastoma-binding protein 5 isoform X3 [Apostichopus japonicus]
MNLQLLESFGQNFPEESDGTLDCISLALTCAFNKRGTLLAVGCNDGRVVIWDFLTRGIAKILSAHVHPVCSVRQKVLVCPMKHAPVLLHMDGSYKTIPLDEDSDTTIVASFDRRGEYIYTGNAKGKMLVFTTESLDLKASFKVTTGTSSSTAIKSIEFARRGGCFLVNTADRVIRVYDCNEVLMCGRSGEPEPIQKLQDLVNRTPWKKCCFSGMESSARQHALYIWEKKYGNLVKILHGTRGELLLDVVWHPVRPIIASVSSGVVSVWAQNQVENWSAYAPDFKELDENVEYDERESEFDIEDEDKSVEDNVDAKAIEDEDVDVTDVEPIAAFLSSDEEAEDEKALLYLPISPEVDDPEEPTWAPQWTLPMKSFRQTPTKEIHPFLSTRGDNKSKKKIGQQPKPGKDTKTKKNRHDRQRKRGMVDDYSKRNET